MKLLVRFLEACSLILICTSCAELSTQTKTSFDRIDPAANKQIIEVLPSSKSIFKATLTAWVYDQSTWRRIFGPWPAVIGRNGFAAIDKKKEGDGKTPSGVYPIGTVFGKEAKVKTGLPYRQTTLDDVWVDDVASAQYNQWVKMPTEAASYEKMLRADGLYDIGAVIEYNMNPVVPGNGSAIFLHIWRENGNKPTAGCVALDRGRFRRILAWLRMDKAPVIVLGDKNDK